MRIGVVRRLLRRSFGHFSLWWTAAHFNRMLFDGRIPRTRFRYVPIEDLQGNHTIPDLHKLEIYVKENGWVRTRMPSHTENITLGEAICPVGLSGDWYDRPCVEVADCLPHSAILRALVHELAHVDSVRLMRPPLHKIDWHGPAFGQVLESLRGKGPTWVDVWIDHEMDRYHCRPLGSGRVTAPEVP